MYLTPPSASNRVQRQRRKTTKMYRHRRQQNYPSRTVNRGRNSSITKNQEYIIPLKHDNHVSKLVHIKHTKEILEGDETTSKQKILIPQL